MPTAATTPNNAQPSSDGLRVEVSEPFRRECIEFFGETVQALGIPRSFGQIYGLLFATPYPLSFTDIAEALDISRGSASQGLQALRSLGAVCAVEGEGRRELFEPELRLRKLMSGVLREKIEPLVAEGAVRLKKLRLHAEAAPTKTALKFSTERMQKLESWRRQTGMLLPLVRGVLSRGRA